VLNQAEDSMITVQVAKN